MTESQPAASAAPQQREVVLRTDRMTMDQPANYVEVTYPDTMTPEEYRDFCELLDLIKRKVGRWNNVTTAARGETP